MSDNGIKQIFTVKDNEAFNGNEIEVFVDEMVRITNAEATFTDKYVQVFFSEVNLNDPSLFNEQELEESQLGSLANYRSKVMVRM